MKTLCPKPGKGGKIHPSPAEDPTAAAFRLLPAAILVLVAGLCPEDQRVLAHLVLVGWDAATAPPPPPEHARGHPRRRRAHPPAVGCPCFECYGSFWSRWDCSPHHDRIHDVLEAFEEHLSAAESAAAVATPPSSKRRDKGKRSRAPAATTFPPPPTTPTPTRSITQSPEPASEVAEEPSSPLVASCPSTPPPPAPAACLPEDKESITEEAAAEAKSEDCGGEVAGEAEAEEERKRGWADVMGGVLNLRHLVAGAAQQAANGISSFLSVNAGPLESLGTVLLVKRSDCVVGRRRGKNAKKKRW